ncbi:MAG TPA: GYD domain-containing protein [Candidatus Binatia bacterium]|nr:GYD domain-containing protein [Candidatus Binatia bacterium]
MAIYISLNTLTDQGARNVKDTTARADAFRDAAKNFGVTVNDIYWTLGIYDAVCVLDAPDDSAIAALQASLAAAGNMRTVTLRAFSRDEMSAILARLGK